MAKNTKTRIKTAKTGPTPRIATTSWGATRQFQRYDWRPYRGQNIDFNGITVWAPVDPYSSKERREFRSAMTNPYVWRASRIQAGFTVGQGYTTEIVPRREEEIPAEQLDQWQKTTTVNVHLDGEKTTEMTAEELLDWVDKKAKQLDLATNLFNAYLLAEEQGRCVLAMLPLEYDDDGFYPLPENIRLLRTEHTERPVIDLDNGELQGCRIIGIKSNQIKDNILPSRRMIYVLHGFNNELFSDYFGLSRVSLISDEANTLNIILNQDYERAAEHTWYKPPIFSVPIPPQEYGNEDNILANFIDKINENKGQAIAVTGPSNPEETGIQILTTPPTADVGSLEILRLGIIKAIITAWGLPGFMLSEGDIGKLGGNANIEEVDAYLNQEIRPERQILEATVENQFYDEILRTLFREHDTSKIPVKIKIKFNKPRLLTLLTPEMFNVLTGLVQNGWIDESGLREVLGLEDVDRETMTTGAEGGVKPDDNLAAWYGWNRTFVPPSPPQIYNRWEMTPQNQWTQQQNQTQRPNSWQKEEVKYTRKTPV